MINNLLEFPEYAVYRAVTGANSVFPRGADGVPTAATPFPTKGTIPMAKTGTGTITSVGTSVRGTGTFFERDLKVDDYVYNNDASVRRIISIESDTMLTLSAAFPSDVSGIALLTCARQEFKLVTAESVGGAAAILQETTFPVGSRSTTFGAPIAYDATAGQIAFTVSK